MGGVADTVASAANTAASHIQDAADVSAAARGGDLKGAAEKLAEKAEKKGHTSWGDRAMQLSAVFGLTQDIGSLMEKNDPPPVMPPAAPTIINMGGGGGFGGDFTNTRGYY